MDHSSTKHGHRSVLQAIADFAAKDTAVAWPSVDKLAARAGLTRRRVQDIIQELWQAGEILWDQSSGGRNRRHRYMIKPCKRCKNFWVSDEVIAKYTYTKPGNFTQQNPEIFSTQNGEIISGALKYASEEISIKEIGIKITAPFSLDRKPGEKKEEPEPEITPEQAARNKAWVRGLVRDMTEGKAIGTRPSDKLAAEAERMSRRRTGY